MVIRLLLNLWVVECASVCSEEEMIELEGKIVCDVSKTIRKTNLWQLAKSKMTPIREIQHDAASHLGRLQALITTLIILTVHR